MKMKIKQLMVCALAVCLAASLSACAVKPAAPSTSGNAEKALKIGVIQFATHPSLDNCYKGFKEGLAENGFEEGKNIKIDFQNAQGDMSNSDLIAKNMVAAKCDMIVAIATPTAMSAYSAAKDSGIPVLFIAVSDPVAAGLVQSLDAPNTGCTGTSDTLNLDGQVKLIRAFLPEAKTIGVLYTVSEPNSVSHLEKLKTIASAAGFEVVAVGINSASEVAAGAATLVAKKVDCVNNFTDNNVVDNLSTLLHATDAAGIPVFGSEIEQVKNGCVASETLDYVKLGAKSGSMASDILSKKADAKTLPVSLVSESVPVYSATNLAKFGLNVPAQYSSMENVDAAK